MIQEYVKFYQKDSSERRRVWHQVDKSGTHSTCKSVLLETIVQHVAVSEKPPKPFCANCRTALGRRPAEKV